VADLPTSGLPLAVMPGQEFELSRPTLLAPDDLLVFVTDGFLEWPAPSGEQYGVKRVEALLREHRGRPAAEVIEAMHRSVVAFADGTKQQDDLTAVIIRRT
jgi:serine phosphatase RsbU (regulator of sigma subunit)